MKNEDYNKDIKNVQKSIEDMEKYLDELEEEQLSNQKYKDNAENIFIAKGNTKRKRKSTNAIGSFLGWVIGIIYYKVIPWGLIFGMMSYGIGEFGTQRGAEPMMVLICFILLIIWANI